MFLCVFACVCVNSRVFSYFLYVWVGLLGLVCLCFRVFAYVCVRFPVIRCVCVFLCVCMCSRVFACFTVFLREVG